MPDTVARFDNRVATYVRARPTYPHTVLTCLVQEYGLGPVAHVADVGAGTGLLTRLQKRKPPDAAKLRRAVLCFRGLSLIHI